MILMHLTINTRNVDIIKLYENATNLNQIQTEKETAYAEKRRFYASVASYLLPPPVFENVNQ